MRSHCTRWSFHFTPNKRLNNIEFRWVFGLWERNLSVSLPQWRPEEHKSYIALRLIYLSVTTSRLSHNTHQSSNILRWSVAWVNLPPSSSSLASCRRVSLLCSSSQWPPAGRRHPQHGHCPPIPLDLSKPSQPGLSWSSNTCHPLMVSFLIHPHHLLHLFYTLFI